MALQVFEKTLTLSEWPQYENGSSISQLHQVREILKRFDEKETMRIVILYPGGQTGNRWGKSMHDWLVVLGIPIEYLELQPGSGGADLLVLQLIDKS